MKPQKLRLQSLAAVVVATCSLALGCGTAEPTAADGGAGAGNPTEGPLLPWAVGNNWTYQVTESGLVSLKTTTIGKRETVGGDGPNAKAKAYHVTTAKGTDLKDHTESWQTPSPDAPDRVVRYREQSFDASTGDLDTDEYWDPEKLHIDGTAEHTVDGADWLESYAETKLPVNLTPSTHDVRERWSVLEGDGTLTVPAGTFEHVIHFRKVGSSTSKEYWYLRGVGKLKETGSQVEELTEYQLQDAP